MTGYTVRRYELLETFPETIEQELRPAVCEHRQENYSIDEHKRGIRTDPLCNSTSIGTYSVPPFCLTTCILIDLYISCTLFPYSSGTPFFRKHHQIGSLGILYNAFSRSTKTMCKSLFFSLHFSCSCRNAKSGCVAFRPFSYHVGTTLAFSL